MNAQGPVGRTLAFLESAQYRAYGEWLRHAQECAACKAAEKPGNGCDAGNSMWTTYREARITPPGGTS